MSEYTTGEIAKLCNVSVRTVQYYDTRNLLVPSRLSDGGRRLYSEEDLKRMRIICFLRDVGLSINGIGELFSDEDPASVIDILLKQQEKLLRRELHETKSKLDTIELLKRELNNTEDFSLESIGDIAYIMENRKKLYRVRATMLSAGLVSEIIETGSLLYGIIKGIWWPFFVGLPFVIGIDIWIIIFYFKRVKYICPKCHTVFKPGFKEMFFANHTPSTRKLTCTHCGHKGFCVETYGKEDEENAD